MSITYTYSSDWIGRDAQPENSPLRIVKAVDFLTEWQAIQAGFAAAAPTVSPTLTGTTSVENLSISGTFSLAGYNNANWDTAYGWGDHSVEGYLTEELDPTVPNYVKAITVSHLENWDEAHSWGDHGAEGYLTTELDPTVPGHVKNISTSQLTDWDEAYSWGDHRVPGYLTSFTETDPTVPAHVKGITGTNISNWNAAYSYGNHAGQGYLKIVNFSDVDSAAVTTSIQTWGGSSNVKFPTVAAVEERLTTGGFINDYVVTEGDVTQHQTAINSGVIITESQISDLGGGSNYLNDAPSDGSQYARKDGSWSPITGASGGTVTSVDASVPTGLAISGGPITSTGTLAITNQSGYAIPTTAKQADWDEAHGWGDHAAAGYVSPSGYNNTSWDTAYGWGNHATAGYASAASISNAPNWNTAFGWGDHATEGYLKATSTEKSNWNTAYAWGNHASEGYLKSFTETDPTVPAHVKAISSQKITNWDNAFTYGNHASAGYLVASSADKTNWDTAYGWGNHSLANYASNNGSNASGTWDISITGNASSATSATSATTATNCSRSVVAGTNLNGGGVMTANRTVNLDTTLTSLTDVQTANLSIGSWDIKLEGNDLIFEYGGVDKLKITTGGAIIAAGDVTAEGTP